MIYFTDTNPDEAASNLCDRHLRKTVRFTQKVFAEASENRTQHRDPHIRWGCASLANLKWVVEHGNAAAHEMYYRFHKPVRIEDSLPLIKAREKMDSLSLPPVDPDHIFFPDEIDKVREFYRLKVFPKSRWTRRYPPDWMHPSLLVK